MTIYVPPPRSPWLLTIIDISAALLFGAALYGIFIGVIAGAAMMGAG